MGNVIKGLSGMLKFDSSINHIKQVTTLLNVMNRELDFFREFVKQYVPKGELITDSHIAAAAWQRYCYDQDVDLNEVDEDFNPDILTPEDFIDKSFFPDL